MTYIDTSVLIASYCPEPLSERAQHALAEERERAISSLVELEFVSALGRKVRARGMRRRDAHRILALFQSHLEQGIFKRLAVEATHFARSREWLGTFALPLQTLDALHVAVAAEKGCSLMTADTALAKSCAKVGVKARLVT